MFSCAISDGLKGREDARPETGSEGDNGNIDIDGNSEVGSRVQMETWDGMDHRTDQQDKSLRFGPR